jgi:MFS family permease
MSVASATLGDGRVVSQAEERRVIFASSLGTVFEWYDFYLYATLAPFFAALFFPPGNETAALLSAFAAYAAGFLVRPFGALVFGRLGDLVGRKYTFLVTILFMGGSTFLVGLLPTFSAVGWLASTISIATAGGACHKASNMSPSNSTLKVGVVWEIIEAIPAELVIAQFLVLNSLECSKFLWLRISSFLQTPSPISIGKGAVIWIPTLDVSISPPLHTGSSCLIYGPTGLSWLNSF